MNKKITHNYCAAWLCKKSQDDLKAAGVEKTPHMTTFFDGYGQFTEMTKHPEIKGDRSATIKAVVEWPVGDKTYLIAELGECEWSDVINKSYLSQGLIQDLPHKPHITLKKNIEKGESSQFQNIVGLVLVFDRHGFE